MVENIWIAASDNDIEAVKQFLENGVDVNTADENGYTPIAAAVSYGHADLARFLLSKGADASFADPDGDRPLHVCETVECAKLLIENGADPAAVNDDGLNAADAATDSELTELVEYFATLGVKPISAKPEVELILPDDPRYESSLKVTIVADDDDDEEETEEADNGGASSSADVD